jgi:hypothetical protein
MKRAKTLVVLMIFSLTFFYRCEIGFDCTLVDEMPDYENLEAFSDAQVAFLIFELDSVFNRDSLQDGQSFVVTDSLTYQSWEAAANNCFNCNFPDIDFDVYTLIGAYYRLGCNDFPSVRIVKEGNNYRHVVKASDLTQCNLNVCDNFTFAWVVIPKDVNATYTFEKGNSYYECEC